MSESKKTGGKVIPFPSRGKMVVGTSSNSIDAALQEVADAIMAAPKKSKSTYTEVKVPDGIDDLRKIRYDNPLQETTTQE